MKSFKKCHNIVFGTLSGERGDVNDTVVDDWKQKLPTLCAGYDAKAIFNMDETSLIYRSVSKNTLKVKGDECAGGKCSKERITPLVIGKARQPRCFSKIKPDSLPVM